MEQLASRTAALLLLAVAAASCGGAAPAALPKAADADIAPDPALRALDEAEAHLALVLGDGAGYAQQAKQGYGQQWAQPPQPYAQPTQPAPAGSAAPVAPDAPRRSQAGPPPPPPPAAPRAMPQAEADQKPSVRRDVTKEQGADRFSGDSCSVACTALASMERAADHLCTVSGAAGDRCQSARDRVKRATARVQAACPACAR